MNLPNCPKCNSEYTYEDGNLLVCPECAYEWNAEMEAENREILYDRINRRVDIMLENGLLAEARAFFQGVPDTAAQAIGYKELKPYLDGVLSLDEAVENLKRATRNYAKRQITWFKRNPQIHWIYADTCSKQALLAQAITFAETETV